MNLKKKLLVEYIYITYILSFSLISLRDKNYTKKKKSYKIKEY